MKSSMAISALVAIAIVGSLIAGGLYWTRNNHLELKGEVLKVRSQSVDPENTVAVIDFRVTNPSTTQFVVKDVDVYMDTADGKTLDGGIFSEIDAQRLFEYYKILGRKYNPTLLMKDKIESGQVQDRMIAVRFPATDPQVAARKGIRLVISDVDGAAKSEITEKKP
jgi:hypothetical protein